RARLAEGAANTAVSSWSENARQTCRGYESVCPTHRSLGKPAVVREARNCEGVAEPPPGGAAIRRRVAAVRPAPEDRRLGRRATGLGPRATRLGLYVRVGRAAGSHRTRARETRRQLPASRGEPLGRRLLPDAAAKRRTRYRARKDLSAARRRRGTGAHLSRPRVGASGLPATGHARVQRAEHRSPPWRSCQGRATPAWGGIPARLHAPGWSGKGAGALSRIPPARPARRQNAHLAADRG